MHVSEKHVASDQNSLITLSPLTPIFEKRKSILRFTIVATLLLTAASFLIPNKYTSKAVILPDVDILSAAQKLGSLQDIASSVGLNLGVTSPSQLYPDILESETILKPVIYKEFSLPSLERPVNLIGLWNFDGKDSLLNYEQCLKKLREKVSTVDVNKKTGILTLTIETKQSDLSAGIANEMIYQLDRYQREFRRTNASVQRKFLDQRLSQVETDLAKDEDALKVFREKNRRVNDSPQLLLEQDRLERNVTLNAALFVELRKQYELVKLDEIKNTPVVQVLDGARPTTEKSSPNRTLILVLSFLLSFGCSTLYWITVSYFKTHASNPSIQQITKMLEQIRDDFIQLTWRFIARKATANKDQRSSVD